jgi:hypothetical protein
MLSRLEEMNMATQFARMFRRVTVAACLVAFAQGAAAALCVDPNAPCRLTIDSTFWGNAGEDHSPKQAQDAVLTLKARSQLRGLAKRVRGTVRVDVHADAGLTGKAAAAQIRARTRVVVKLLTDSGLTSDRMALSQTTARAMRIQ